MKVWKWWLRNLVIGFILAFGLLAVCSLLVPRSWSRRQTLTWTALNPGARSDVALTLITDSDRWCQFSVSNVEDRTISVDLQPSSLAIEVEDKRGEKVRVSMPDFRRKDNPNQQWVSILPGNTFSWDIEMPESCPKLSDVRAIRLIQVEMGPAETAPKSTKPVAMGETWTR
ncbi:MAG: hypothetical protein JST35_06515 [Armatimonadetes bacterium]|nr:hypothetical protein [Armatimonadota bacterium]